MNPPGLLAAAAAPVYFGLTTFQHQYSGRRWYESGNNPDYVDDFGWSSPGNPYAAQGWKFQIWMQADTFECNPGFVRYFRCLIGGTFTGVQQVAGVGGDNSGSWQTIANLSGAVTFTDEVNDNENDGTGLLTFRYRYSRI